MSEYNTVRNQRHAQYAVARAQMVERRKSDWPAARKMRLFVYLLVRESR